MLVTYHTRAGASERIFECRSVDEAKRIVAALYGTNVHLVNQL